MTLSGFMPNAAVTSLGSIVLTRSARRVERHRMEQREDAQQH